MERTQSKKWLVIIIFGMTCILLAVSLRFLFENMLDPDILSRWRSRRRPPPVIKQTSDRLLMPKDKGIVVDGLIITYRGTKDRNILMDVILLDLDREYSYRHEVPQKEAKQGFFLSERQFRAVSVNSKNMLLSQGKH